MREGGRIEGNQHRMNGILGLVRTFQLVYKMWKCLHRAILLDLSLIYKSLGLIHSPGKCISIINFVALGK